MPAIEARDFEAALDEVAAQGLAEEATPTGDEDLHGVAILRFASSRVAHAASFSRPILALWRMSTGKPRCGRKCLIFAVWTWPSAMCRNSSGRSAALCPMSRGIS